MDVQLIQLLNGISFGAILYLVSVGLTLAFGVGRFLNLAHGGFYLLGAYIGISLAEKVNFWVGAVVAPLAVGVLALVIERVLLRRWAGEHRAIEQLLLTFGLAFILNDVMQWIWGGSIRIVQAPAPLDGSISLGIVQFPVYRLFLIVLGIVIALGLQLLLRRTRLGTRIRAAAADADIAQTIGIDPGRVLALTFAAGVAMAAFAGALGAPVLATASGRDFSTLIIALIVVAIGGMGSVSGTFWAAMLVGVIDTMGKVWVPRLSVFTVYLLLAVVLVVRPQGLFTRGRA